MRNEYTDVPVEQVIEEEGVGEAISKKHVASVLYTYRCTLSCRHCCFHSSPLRPDVHVGLEQGLEYLAALHELDRAIHLAGGEAMIYWDDMVELCREANRDGIAPHFIETNATWCVSNDIAKRRMGELRENGVRGLLISACTHHQRECPPERFHRCLHTAIEVFGDENVAAPRPTMEELEEMVALNQDEERFAEWVRKHPPCLVARAGEELAKYLPDRPIEELAEDPMWHGAAGSMSCAREFDPELMWEIHIDPYGNVQTCCGIVIAIAEPGRAREALRGEVWDRNPIVQAVRRAGPLALLELAEERGYQRREGYPQKCGMCYELRKFLRPYFPEVFGPDEVYVPA